MPNELLKGLSNEQIAKIKACKNQEELLAYAKAEGIELTDEQLAAVSGGFHCTTPTFTCPDCQSHDVDGYEACGHLQNYWDCTCRNCGKHWTW